MPFMGDDEMMQEASLDRSGLSKTWKDTLARVFDRGKTI